MGERGGEMAEWKIEKNEGKGWFGGKSRKKGRKTACAMHVIVNIGVRQSMPISGKRWLSTKTKAKKVTN